MANSLSISYTITFTHHEKQKMKKEIIKKTRGSEKEHKVELTQFTMLLANYVYTKNKTKQKKQKNNRVIKEGERQCGGHYIQQKTSSQSSLSRGVPL